MDSKLPQNSDQIQLVIVKSTERSINVSDAAVTLAGPQLRTAERLFGIPKTGSLSYSIPQFFKVKSELLARAGPR